MTRLSLATPFAACLLASALIGCAGEGAGLYEVAGEVSFNGQPLDQGTIRFDPDDPERCGNGGASIADGKYAIAKIRGLKPGTYTVRISSGDAQVSEPPTEAPGQARPVAKERIPASWNANSANKIEVIAGKNFFEHNIP